MPHVNSETWPLQVSVRDPSGPVCQSMIRKTMAAWQLAFALVAVLDFAGDAAPITGRGLLQSSLSINPSDPISATTADLVNDPQGRGHLLVRLLLHCQAVLLMCSTIRSVDSLSDPPMGP